MYANVPFWVVIFIDTRFGFSLSLECQNSGDTVIYRTAYLMSSRSPEDNNLDVPKSAILTLQLVVTNRFCGLRSLCILGGFRECFTRIRTLVLVSEWRVLGHTRNCIPLATSRHKLIFCFHFNEFGSALRIECNDPLATYSVIRNGVRVS